MPVRWEIFVISIIGYKGRSEKTPVYVSNHSLLWIRKCQLVVMFFTLPKVCVNLDSPWNTQAVSGRGM